MTRRVYKIVFALSAAVILIFYFWGLNVLGSREATNSSSDQQRDGMDMALDKGWKFHPGDQELWASPSFNDSSWSTVHIDSMPESYSGELAWFRYTLHSDAALLKNVLALSMRHHGASEVFVDGVCVARFGRPSSGVESEEVVSPEFMPVNFQLHSAGTHLLAVRYSNNHYSGYRQWFQNARVGFSLHLVDDEFVASSLFSERFAIILVSSLAVFLFTLSFVHLLLFLFYRKSMENLYYFLFAFCYALIFLTILVLTGITATPWMEYVALDLLLILLPLLMLSLLQFVHSIFQNPFPKWLWIGILITCGIIILDSVTNLINQLFAFSAIMTLLMFSIITMITETIRAVRSKIRGARILGAGIGIFTTFIFVMVSLFFYSGSINFSSSVLSFMAFGAMMSIPICMSIYLAYDFSRTNNDLSLKLVQVEELSAKTILQEKERQEILSRQKETLEIQVKERTREVVEQKKVIEEKNKDITDSINYARRIQDAILPSDEQVKLLLPDSFVLYKPKDIVSGDFYFLAEANGKVVAAAVDCTGHGVPGAFMSMVGYNHLKRIVNEQGVTDTSRILDELHKQVLLSMNRDITKRDSKDGMDVAIVSVDKLKREVQFSGAVRPLYYFVNGVISEVKGERYSIAGIKEIDGVSYASTLIQAKEPTTFYLFSDGFADQFGGKEGKKLMSKNFRELLARIQDRTMQEQKDYLDKFITEWKGSREQMDDIMVIGIKI